MSDYRKPQTRAELIVSLKERLERGKEKGEELFFMESWEAAWVIIPEAARLAAVDTNGTAQLVGYDFEATERNEVVRITGPEGFVYRLGCEDVTSEVKANE
mgnify:CR=1 FL=1